MVKEKLNEILKDIHAETINELLNLVKVNSEYLNKFDEIHCKYYRLLYSLQSIMDTYNNKEEIISEIEELYDKIKTTKEELITLEDEKRTLESDIIYLKEIKNINDR